MISVKDYFGPKLGDSRVTEALQEIAALMLGKVNALLEEAKAAGAYSEEQCPYTGTCVSGSHHTPPTGDGGFRFQNSATGAFQSAHKLARAVDIFDPLGQLDRWLDQFEGEHGANSKLEEHGLYREAPSSTPTWTHLQDIPPHSGRRTFFP